MTLLDLIEKSGKSRAEIAALAGIDRSALHKIIHGSNPKLSTVCAIALALKVSPATVIKSLGG